MDSPYEPISCSVHDEFLALATLRRECQLTVVVNGQEMTVDGVIADVYTSKNAEYLQMRAGQIYRLDQVHALNGKTLT
jgi:transcriptional antiterminator Rof (Rho-off)